MPAVCLLVAGALRAVLPGDAFTLAWEHSVQKTQWKESYRIAGDRLVLVEARVQGSGAGMEPGPGARLQDGWWTWRPAVAPLPSLVITLSPYTSDYQVCTRDGCTALGSLVAGGDDAAVTLRVCDP